MLYNKYRPRYFNEIIGQENNVNFLLNILQNNSNIHSFIFYGPNGTGKTSTARLLAKSINCPAFMNEKSPINHCNCNFCTSFQLQDYTDIIEIDGAINNGVEFMREIIKNSAYPPMLLSKKIYIIDESHCLSSSSWNALLKLIEEPPEHLILIFLTTKIERIIPTILSRCQKLHFPEVKSSVIYSLLEKVSRAEGKQIEPNLLHQISISSSGSVREALNILEKIFLNESNKGCSVLLEEESRRIALKLLNNILDSEYTSAIEELKKHPPYSWALIFHKLLEQLLELSFFQLSSSPDLLLNFQIKDATSIISKTPALDKMISFLAPILLSNTFKFETPSVPKFIVLNLFALSTLEAEKDSTSNLTKGLDKPKTGIISSSNITRVSSNRKNPNLPETKELFTLFKCKWVSFYLPEFKLDQIFKWENNILSILKNCKRSISEDTYTSCAQYLDSENALPIIIKLFQEMHPKYNFISSKDSSLVVFKDENQANYFNLQYLNIEIKRELEQLFKKKIELFGISTKTLNKYIKKSKNSAYIESNFKMATHINQDLMQRITQIFPRGAT